MSVRRNVPVSHCAVGRPNERDTETEDSLCGLSAHTHRVAAGHKNTFAGPKHIQLHITQVALFMAAVRLLTTQQNCKVCLRRAETGPL